MTTWIGIFSPAGLSDAAASRLLADVNKALATAELAKSFTAAGIEPYLSTRQEFSERVRADYEKYAKLIKQFGVKVDN